MADLTRTFDVLVIGGGNAALCAAIAARRAGASVLVLEGAPRFYRGGNTRHTRNMRCAHDAATETLSGPYTEEEFFDDLLRVTQGQTDEALARFMIAQSKEILEWIPEQGVRFQPSLGGTLSLGRTNSFFLGGGRSMLNALYLTAERLGVEVEYDAEVVDLDVDSGTFRSAAAALPVSTGSTSAPSITRSPGGSIPAVPRTVGNRSLPMTGASTVDPGGTCPGQRTIPGTRMPPSCRLRLNP
jgi:tricarballylate dehydrogenase